MRPSGAFVRAAALTNYVKVASEVGLTPSRLLRDAHLDAKALSSIEIRLPAATVGSLLEKSAALSGCSNFGLRMAESRRLSDFGTISLLLMHQPTVSHAMAIVTRYQNMLNEALAMRIEESRDLVLIKEELVADFPGRKTQSVELLVGVMYGLIRSVLGEKWNALSVHFVHAAPGDLSVHRRFFRAPVQFESEFNGIVCSASDFHKPNAAADPVLAQYAERYIDTMQSEISGSTANDVRRAIYLLLPISRASIVHVASTLGLNIRTLQRRLAHEGAEFSSLLNQVRRELAVRYIADRRHSITRIAGTLGYVELSSFTRWFIAEFGKSPGKWRKQEIDARAPAGIAPRRRRPGKVTRGGAPR
ncbi:MAG: AraC family transcriptional regulator [Proteobacteria bacterium]|nr:AraC family transcriptional regulator [Pseudomonadota bacterium]